MPVGAGNDVVPSFRLPVGSGNDVVPSFRLPVGAGNDVVPSMTFFVIPDLIGDLDVNVFQFSFAAEVLTDEVLSVYGVVTHIELHNFRNRLLVA